MTIRDMEILVEVARCLNMTEASKNLYISQSTVSQVIAGIEREYNIRLFERINKRIILTEQGKIAVSHSKKVLDAYNEMEIAVRFAGEEVIRVGSDLITSSSILNDIWVRYHRVCPKVKTRMVIEDGHLLKNRLLDYDLDFVLLEYRLPHGDLVNQKIGEDSYVLICNQENEFAARDSVSLTELSGANLIMREQGNPTRDLFDNTARRYHYDITVADTYSNIDVIKAEVVKGGCVSIMAKKLVTNELAMGRLHSCEISDFKEKREFYVIYNNRLKLTPNFKSFIENCGCWPE